MIYEYTCQKCGQVQEKWHKMKEKNKEPCEKCGADAKDLKRDGLEYSPKHHGHISWSKWKV